VQAVSCGSKDDAHALGVMLYNALSAASLHQLLLDELYELLGAPRRRLELGVYCQGHGVRSLPPVSPLHASRPCALQGA
jgi:hypothetical protein